MENKKLVPNFLFEVSWEVCNKVGGIYTVLSTKAYKLEAMLGSQYILVGPDIVKDAANERLFIQDDGLYHKWVKKAREDGLKIRIGRWQTKGNPITILVDFRHLFDQRDKIFTDLWIKYKLDSLYGGWDYIEPALFGYEAGKVIHHFYEHHVTAQDKIVANFHEWLTGAGILYLEDKVPQVGTTFTTHATTLGRTIAGNGLPLYNELANYDPQQMSKQFNIISKYSMEKCAANNADAFSTVSPITANECNYFLGKQPSIITPNSFDIDVVPKDEEYDKIKATSREKIIRLFKATSGAQAENPLLVLISGRYEMRNKGIDLFIKSLSKLKNQNPNRNIFACIAIPSGIQGPIHDVLDAYNNDTTSEHKYLTSHYLNDEDTDPIINAFRNEGLLNQDDNPVKVLFIPSYLDGNDGLLNISYYEFLMGFDLTIFPSYYEPWGYTPMESTAFGIPTLTTTLSGYGNWVKSLNYDTAEYIRIVDRNDYNDDEIVDNITNYIREHLQLNDEQRISLRNQCWQIAKLAHWDNFINYYFDLYDIALKASEKRIVQYYFKTVKEYVVTSPKEIDVAEWRKIFVKPEYPQSLLPLVELTQNLWWTWDDEATEFMKSINPVYWVKSDYNPIAMLEMMSYEEIINLSQDKSFIEKLNAIYKRFKDYMSLSPYKENDKLVAYLCMEYGIHSSLKIYSGGLGMLAGDYLKEASDSNFPIVAFGLLFRYGYFKQILSRLGEQIAHYIPQKFTKLPIIAVRDSNDEWMKIQLPFPGRNVFAKLWQVNVGRIHLYLLDTDIEENEDEDKEITARLYDANWEMRLKQEYLLGFGSIYAMRAMGISPNIFHLNEGHAAFANIARLKYYIKEQHLPFQHALEIVRKSSIFTTHTPVPAGHDKFSENLMRAYFAHIPETLDISWDEFMDLGRVKRTDEEFSVTHLAIKTSVYVNAVSKIHKNVTCDMFKDLYRGFFNSELFIDYVTNAVHPKTWMCGAWQKAFLSAAGNEFFEHMHENHDYWKFIDKLKPSTIWKIKTDQKHELYDKLVERLAKQMPQRQELPGQIIHTLEELNNTPEILTIGFARRFATYKRAHLIFIDLKRLASIVNNPQYPVRFIFSGKAHPSDKAGEDLIKRIIEVSRMPEFIGKIIFVENYDTEFAKLLLKGVDVWLNTPTRPLEASGTSGMKAVMNGTLNFSVLDGWWAEGYIPGGGWALRQENTYDDPELQDQLDAEMIYSILEDEIVPTFYERDSEGVPQKWIEMIKNAYFHIAPHFITKRMLLEYDNKFYNNLFNYYKTLSDNDYQNLFRFISWKRKIYRNWDEIKLENIEMFDSSERHLPLGDKFYVKLIIDLKGLKPDDVIIELIFGKKEEGRIVDIEFTKAFDFVSCQGPKAIYECTIPMEQSGVYNFSIRLRPQHPLLAHKQDFYLVRWL